MTVLLFAVAPARDSRQVPVVLLVEDHIDTRQMYAEFLEGTFAIIQAGNAEEALSAARERVPDVLVTDLSLPGVDGLELISRIRRYPGLQRIPVVCVSGYGGYLHEERAREAGCDRVLQKPCLPDVLADTIHEVLGSTARRGDT